MTPRELLRFVTEQGIRLDHNGEQLFIDAPSEVMNRHLLAEIRRHKQWLIRALGPNRLQPNGKQTGSEKLALKKTGTA